MPSPLVSVVIPTFNRAGLLNRAVESVVAQSHEHWELIIVDDGSTDGTPKQLALWQARLKGRLVALRQSNQGSSAARNLGIDAARGDLIAFLDSDDEFRPDKLERQVELFSLRPNLGLVYSDYAYIDLDGVRHDSAMQAKWPQAGRIPKIAVAPRLYECPGLFDHLVRGYFLATIVGMVRRDVLAKGIRFPVGLSYAEEWLFFLRVARVAAAGFVNEPLSIHHATPGSLARTDKHANVQGRLEILHAIENAFPDLERGQRRAINNATVHTQRQLAFDALRSGLTQQALSHAAAAWLRRPNLETSVDVLRFLGHRLAGRKRPEPDFANA